MRCATSWSRPSRIAVAVLVLALSPLAALAQGNGVPRAIGEFSPPTRAQSISAQTGKALNEAISAMNAKRFAAARTAIGELRLNRLSPYERGMVELILFNSYYAESKFAEARPHLVNALESGGLSDEQAAAAQEQIKRIDAWLASAPRA
ncbi:MAG TPA: hypothetical protein VFL84_11245 [Gammaproteobacteria bacterium]|nr:hypothetical protein [Gammaproteobacteria bacterium]